MESRTLLVIRHGHAVAASGRDSDRPLSERGRIAMAGVGAALAAGRWLPGVILSSPYRRARETAEILAGARAPRASVRFWAALEPEGDPADVLAELSRTAGPWAVVSHMPLVSRLVARIARDAPDPSFAPGSVALLHLPDGASGRGSLRWLSTPGEIAGRDAGGGS